MNDKVTAVVALGANMGKPRQQVEAAIAALNQVDGVRLKAISPLYITRAVGKTDQSDFVNAVVMVETSLAAHKLLQVLQDLEQDFGRTRSERNGPRTLDLDLIDYDKQIINDRDLILPHPRAHERAFVMKPLACIAPSYILGTGIHDCAAILAAQLLHDKPEETVTLLA